MKLGDMVSDGAGLKGRVVANIDGNEFTAECPKRDWAYLDHGILVETEEAGLVHSQNAADLTVLSTS